MTDHSNAWYVENRHRVHDLRAEAENLRTQSRALVLEANKLSRTADQLEKATAVFEGQAIHVSNTGKDQYYLQSLPDERNAIVYRDRKSADDTWKGVIEADGEHKASMGTGWTRDDIMQAACKWVAFGKVPVK